MGQSATDSSLRTITGTAVEDCHLSKVDGELSLHFNNQNIDSIKFLVKPTVTIV